MSDVHLYYDIYEVSTYESPINGVKFRGRIRKFGLNNDINVLVENTQDKANGVRFAVLNKPDAAVIKSYVHHVLPDATVTLVLEHIPNPVLSKLKVNLDASYEL